MLKQKLIRYGAVVLTAVLLLGLVPVERAAAKTDYSNHVVRAGLFYGSSALTSAKLSIIKSSGTGFDMGYYADDRTFQKLYTLQNTTDITVTRSLHYDYAGDTYVADGATASTVAGAWHIELGRTFETEDDLRLAVLKVRQLTNYYAYPAYTSNGYRVRLGRYTTVEAANADMPVIASRLAEAYPGATLSTVGKGTNGYTVYQPDSKNVLFEFDGATRQLGVRPIGAEPETQLGTHSYMGGFDFAKVSSNQIQVVSVVNLVQYVKGVTPYELNSYWPIESLKAHAACAGTLAVSCYNTHRHWSSGFDVCNTQHCQVYRGTTLLTQKIKDCVDAVHGAIITYNGKPIDAVYHSTNGGYTENSENVWGGYVPYLRGVKDTYETLSYSNNGLWTKSLTAQEITDKLVKYGNQIGLVNNIYISQYTEFGNVYALSFTDGVNVVTLERENMRSVLGSSTLLSQNFKIVDNSKIYINDGTSYITGLTDTFAITHRGTIVPVDTNSRAVLTSEGLTTVSSASASGESTFTFDGKGWGHSLGLSQYGSRGMSGLGWTYDQILKYYFTGVQISGLDY